MNRSYVLAAVVLFVGSLVQAGQDCGATVTGGTIAQGLYSGAGSTKKAADEALRDDLGVEDPECAPCPARGCKGSVAFEDDQIAFTGPSWNISCAC